MKYEIDLNLYPEPREGLDPVQLGIRLEDFASELDKLNFFVFGEFAHSLADLFGNLGQEEILVGDHMSTVGDDTVTTTINTFDEKDSNEYEVACQERDEYLYHESQVLQGLSQSLLEVYELIHLYAQTNNRKKAEALNVVKLAIEDQGYSQQFNAHTLPLVRAVCLQMQACAQKKHTHPKSMKHQRDYIQKTLSRLQLY